MDVLIPILFVLVILLVIVTVVGHLIWVTLAWLFRTISGSTGEPGPHSTTTILSPTPTTPSSTQHHCANCQCALSIELKYCGVCGARRPTLAQEEQLRELEITLRQLKRLHKSGAVAESDFRALETRIAGEREQILFPQGRPGAARQPSHFTPEATAQKKPTPPASAEQTPPRSVTEPPPESPRPDRIETSRRMDKGF